MKKILTMIIAILVITNSLIIMSFAEKNADFKFVANDSQLNIINRIYGTDITYYEYLSLVYPDSLAFLTPSDINLYRNKKMDWPEKTITPRIGGLIVNSSIYQKSDKSLLGVSRTNFASPDIDVIEIVTFNWIRQKSTGLVVASGTDKTTGNSSTAEATYSGTVAGEEYKTTASHSAKLDPSANPSILVGSSESPWYKAQ